MPVVHPANFLIQLAVERIGSSSTLFTAMVLLAGSAAAGQVLAAGSASPIVQACHQLSNRIAVTPDSRFAVDSSMLGDSLCVTDLVQGNIVKHIKAFPSGSTIQDFAITPDGKRVVATAKNVVNVINLETGGLMKSFTVPQDIWKMHLSPDGSLMIALSGVFDHTKAWTLETGKLAFNIMGPKGNPKKRLIGDIMRDGIGAPAMSPDGKIIVGYNRDKLAFLDGKTGRFLTFLEGGSGSIDTLSFTRDGKHILDVRHDRKAATEEIEQWLQIWDVEKRKIVKTLPTSRRSRRS